MLKTKQEHALGLKMQGACYLKSNFLGHRTELYMSQLI
jgi:hypothetical protein